MHKLALSTVLATAILATGFLMPKHWSQPPGARRRCRPLRRSRMLRGAAGTVTGSTIGRSSFTTGRSSRFIASTIGRSFAGGGDGFDADAGCGTCRRCKPCQRSEGVKAVATLL
jgi:hypothetical protein